ncbi:hypothetical protein H6G33_36165 [Calothrix sp. FACHB-1219]|uniref:hypothetical protein n=1 Tax=unclassified Calothrix TaxID=2619626 RepID=UPI0016863A60|nr:MULTISPECIES: hypothetical protein [unclassified Calothrix]MBD2202391.1 hypothetical protein [Calothrix sp. FACHB-168]MBD2222367.1 hypothetical protein [Calothrix sp. FACHB-1219]
MLDNNQTTTITLNEYLYEMLDKIKQKPGIFLGKYSITRLRAFLDGYMSSREDLGLPPTQQEIEFNQFPDWIQTRFKITSAHGWDSIILFYSEDEREALNNFFELFEQFRNGENATREAINQEQVIESKHSLIPQ